ncbi:MAG: ABC transporter permease [Pseudomonadota bacterium]
MRQAIVKIMLLNLLRDRATLAMSFLLPGIVFAIFAVIFAGASGGELAIRVAVLDQRANAASKELLGNLFQTENLQRVAIETSTVGELANAVRDGAADAAVVVYQRSGPLERPPLPGQKHFEILTDPSKEIASSMLAGLLQEAYVDRLPKPPGADRIIVRRSVIDADGGFTAVSYYAGAVAMMFLLFSTLTAALSYLDERERGLLDRLALGPGGVGIIIDGKFIFLVLQGFVQTTIVFLVAWLGFGIALPDKVLPWMFVAVCSAVSAAGIALAFVTLCRSKQQAETVGQMLVLIISAIGGSMVPRFMMPAEVQTLGWLTPNTWALEAYASIFWRGDPVTAVMLPGALLVASGLGGLIIARLVSRRTLRTR